MAVDIILLIDGIKGETQIKEFKDKGGIDVLSWNWGMTQSGTTHMGPGGGSGKVNADGWSGPLSKVEEQYRAMIPDVEVGDVEVVARPTPPSKPSAAPRSAGRR